MRNLLGAEGRQSHTAKHPDPEHAQFQKHLTEQALFKVIVQEGKKADRNALGTLDYFFQKGFSYSQQKGRSEGVLT